ncbi:MAG: thiolase family protein [Planctomycetes bacterium]|nr:thiolase family protein [Planctomycetota bacterium]
MICARITGIGETAVGRLPDRDSLALHAEAASATLADAGAEWRQVDGLLTCGSFVDRYPRHALSVAEYLGLCEQLTACQSIHMGGASATMAVAQAKLWIESGLCRSVLVLGADNQATGLSRDAAVEMYARFRHPDYEVPFGLLNPSGYALLAAAHMHRFGTRPEQLAEVAVSIRHWARLNPTALYREPLEVADVLASRTISSPLKLLECSALADGGGGLLLQAGQSSAGGVAIVGHGVGFTHDHVIQAPDLTSSGARLSGKRAFAMAGLSPDQIQVAELYDSYTIAVIIQLEDLGFCGPGEGGLFVEEQGIRPGGALPVATHGGLLSHAHPGAPGGIFHLTEAVRQLRGTATGRQVPNIRHALVHGEGGILSANCTLILTQG